MPLSQVLVTGMSAWLVWEGPVDLCPPSLPVWVAGGGTGLARGFLAPVSQEVALVTRRCIGWQALPGNVSLQRRKLFLIC